MPDPKEIFSRFRKDDFVTTAAEPWFEEKALLIGHYAQSFVTHLAGKVDDIVFVDLFAGSGLYAMGRHAAPTPEPSFACLAMNLPVSKWILCEANPDSANALRVRVNRYFRALNVQVLDVSQERLVERLSFYVPPSKAGHRVAVLCLVDPFSIDLPFETLPRLAGMGFHFLMPFTFPLNRRLDFRTYLGAQRARLVAYVGGQHHFDAIERGAVGNWPFYKRVVRAYQNNMLTLGMGASLTVHKLHSALMDLPAYYMGLFTRNIPARTIQREVQREQHQQYALF